MAVITTNTPRQETSPKTRTFEDVDTSKAAPMAGPHTTHDQSMFKKRQDGGMLMNAPTCYVDHGGNYAHMQWIGTTGVRE